MPFMGTIQPKSPVYWSWSIFCAVTVNDEPRAAATVAAMWLLPIPVGAHSSMLR